eukprot:767091-Hanusia_phi.AAC.5
MGEEAVERGRGGGGGGLMKGSGSIVRVGEAEALAARHGTLAVKSKPLSEMRDVSAMLALSAPCEPAVELGSAVERPAHLCSSTSGCHSIARSSLHLSWRRRWESQRSPAAAEESLLLLS